MHLGWRWRSPRHRNRWCHRAPDSRFDCGSPHHRRDDLRRRWWSRRQGDRCACWRQAHGSHQELWRSRWALEERDHLLLGALQGSEEAWHLLRQRFLRHGESCGDHQELRGALHGGDRPQAGRLIRHTACLLFWRGKPRLFWCLIPGLARSGPECLKRVGASRFSLFFSKVYKIQIFIHLKQNQKLKFQILKQKSFFQKTK